MKRFRVEIYKADEIVYHTFTYNEIEAKTKQEAIEIAKNSPYDYDDCFTADYVDFNQEIAKEFAIGKNPFIADVYAIEVEPIDTKKELIKKQLKEAEDKVKYLKSLL